MMRVKNQGIAHPDGPYICDEYCKVHWYWDFEIEAHVPYPWERWWRQNNQWIRMRVHVGPPAYYPAKPTQEQMTNMEMHCPHEQMDLTCNTCLRHTFRPMEI
jgi:hypothetical protein